MSYCVPLLHYQANETLLHTSSWNWGENWTCRSPLRSTQFLRCLYLQPVKMGSEERTSSICLTDGILQALAHHSHPHNSAGDLDSASQNAAAIWQGHHLPAWSQAILMSGHNMYLSPAFFRGMKSAKALNTVVSPCHRTLYTEKDLLWLSLGGTTEDFRVVLMLLCGADIVVRLLLGKEDVPATWVTLKWMYTLTRHHWERRKLKQWNKILFFY